MERRDETTTPHDFIYYDTGKDKEIKIPYIINVLVFLLQSFLLDCLFCFHYCQFKTLSNKLQSLPQILWIFIPTIIMIQTTKLLYEVKFI